MRIMWLLNHKTLRNIELSLLKNVGFEQIFTPKFFPYDESNLSANIDYSHDKDLNLSKADIDTLNAQNWYEDPSNEAWDIANKYFDVIIIGFFPHQIKSVIKNFKGQIILCVFGLSNDSTYSNLLKQYLNPYEYSKLINISHRFYFGAGYEHLSVDEDDFLKERNLFLPVGLDYKDESNLWEGKEKKILFVCPRIETSPYYKNIYKLFKKNFDSFDYIIGGFQPISVEYDKKVLGYIDQEQYEYNMKQMRVMFYHSQEKNHIHYHPFEAISRGMPLVYMSGSLLDSLGGDRLPGRCKNLNEAHKKIKKILDNDTNLIEEIRSSQKVLLEKLSKDNCLKHFKLSFQKVLKNINYSKIRDNALISYNGKKKYKICVLIPIGYKGGSLRAAKEVAKSLYKGAKSGNENVEIIFSYLDMGQSYYDFDEFHDIPDYIKLRPYRWEYFDKTTAQQILYYKKMDYNLNKNSYIFPNDDMNYFLDCDLFVIISDRLPKPLLPIIPYVCIVYDYLQRREPLFNEEKNKKFLDVAHASQRVIVTTEATRNDAIQFSNLDVKKVFCLPHLIPEFHQKTFEKNKKENPYFIWTTNLANHKNHENAILALKIYYEQLNGNLLCYVTGFASKKIKEKDCLKDFFKHSKHLQSNVRFYDNLSEFDYQKKLFNSSFLWHCARIDNGTFSVVEAAFFSVPSLSSDYPAMREIDTQFSLNLTWMDPFDPKDMAYKLKYMEENFIYKSQHLPHPTTLKNSDEICLQYWQAIRGVL